MSSEPKETQTVTKELKPTIVKVAKDTSSTDKKQKSIKLPEPERPVASSVIEELQRRIETPYPLILVVTFEEARFIEYIMEYIVGRTSNTPLEYNNNTNVFVWSFTQGLTRLPISEDPTEALHSAEPDEETQDPNAALDFINKYKLPQGVSGAVFIMRDLHKFWERIDICRRMRDIVEGLPIMDKVIIVTAPEMNIPVELDKNVSVLDFDLPSKEEVNYEVKMSLYNLGRDDIADNDDDNEILGAIKETEKIPQIKVDYSPEEIEHIVDACIGLTRFEIWCAIGKCIEPGNSEIDVGTILAEKEQIVAKSGIIEFWRSTETLNDIGGLGAVKEYIEYTKYAFTDAAHQFGVDWPRGMLLLGKPGSAKSLLVKATANHYQIPCLRLDVGKIMAGVVGGSESNTRRALKTAEAVAPCVLWIDEIEKGLSGTGSSNFSDAGTMARVFGTIMQWMQDRKAPVYVMATANNIDQLPPELLRKGRMDEIFFVDIPVKEEKMEIFRIHLSKRKRSPSNFDLDRLSDISYVRKGKVYEYSGAEIEAAVQEGIRRAYALAVKNKRTPKINGKYDLNTDLLIDTLQEIVPLSCTYQEQMVKMRKWAMNRARFASKLSEDEIRKSAIQTVSASNDSGDTLTADLNVSDTTQSRKSSKNAVSRMQKGTKKK